MENTPEAIGARIIDQDNRCTCSPMYCVQRLVRDVGYDPAYTHETAWIDVASGDYEEVPPGTEGAEEFGYKDRWETVMVAFTEAGCEEYLAQDGHNVRRRAHNGQVRIHVESFQRCDEMTAIRKALIDSVLAADSREQTRTILNALLKRAVAMDEDTPLEEAVEQMTDEWIDEGRYSAQTVFDLRDALRIALCVIRGSCVASI